MERMGVVEFCFLLVVVVAVGVEKGKEGTERRENGRREE